MLAIAPDSAAASEDGEVGTRGGQRLVLEDDDAGDGVDAARVQRGEQRGGRRAIVVGPWAPTSAASGTVLG